MLKRMSPYEMRSQVARHFDAFRNGRSFRHDSRHMPERTSNDSEDQQNV